MDIHSVPIINIFHRNRKSIVGHTPRILLITGWWHEQEISCVEVALGIVDVLKPLSCELTWVVTNHSVDRHQLPKYADVDIEEIKSKVVYSPPLSRAIAYYALHQIRITMAILHQMRRSNLDIVVFAKGADLFLVPMLISRSLGSKVIIRSDTRPSRAPSYKSDGMTWRWKTMLFDMIERPSYLIANGIVPQSECMIDQCDLRRYGNKVKAGSQYVDTSTFHINRAWNDRTYHIGYAGRLIPWKGILELLQALRILSNVNQRVVIIGEGPLRDEIVEYTSHEAVGRNVDLLGWVEKEDMAAYLNNLKLLVLPSEREGLPNIVLEAMACGTLVLATPVGGIPDVIKDGETGFVLQDNSPECIARNIERAMSHPDIHKIISNAHGLIEREFTYEASVERYRRILNDME